MRIGTQIPVIMKGKTKATEFPIVIVFVNVQEAMKKNRLVVIEVEEVVAVDSEDDLENFVVVSEEVGETVAQQEEVSGAIEDRTIEEITETIVGLLEDIEKIEVHSEEEVVFEDVRKILMEIEKDLFKAGRVLVILEMKTMIIKGILVVMTELNLGMNEQEVLEEYDVHSEVDFEKIVVDLEVVEEIVAQPEEV